MDALLESTSKESRPTHSFQSFSSQDCGVAILPVCRASYYNNREIIEKYCMPAVHSDKELMLSRSAKLDVGGCYVVINDSNEGCACFRDLISRISLNINEKDKFGLAPIHYCARFEQTDLAELLISRGADLNLCGKLGWGELPPMAPIYHALVTFNSRFLHLLLSKMTRIDVNVDIIDYGFDIASVMPGTFKPFVVNLTKLCPYSFLMLQAFKSIFNNDRHLKWDVGKIEGNFRKAVKCVMILNEFAVPAHAAVFEICCDLLRGKEWLSSQLTLFQHHLLISFISLIQSITNNPKTLLSLSRKCLRELVEPPASMELPHRVLSYLKHEGCNCNVDVSYFTADPGSA